MLVTVVEANCQMSLCLCLASLVSTMSLNDNKAGMQGLDKERINQIIYEASKGEKLDVYLIICPYYEVPREFEYKGC